MRRIRGIIILLGILFLRSCATSDNSDSRQSRQVIVIFADCPRQTSTDKFGDHLSQINYSTVAYIDENGGLMEYEPRLSGRDTIVIPTYRGYAELMHLYQALECDYYLLKEGDTVLVRYDANDRPILNSLVSESNTQLYNLPYVLPGAIQHKGYYIETILSDANFLKAFAYFKDRDRFANPDLDTYLRPRYVNLDSLSVVYGKYQADMLTSLDSLLQHNLMDSGYYDYYYRRAFPEHRYRPSEIVQSDSLLHYISNYITAQEYGGTRNTLDSFDYIIDDTLATPLAKKGILKRLMNSIIDGEGGWHIYSEDIISRYLQKYQRLTGDLMLEKGREKKAAVVDSSDYSLPLETIDGETTSLEELLARCRGSLVYIDLWASWCAPCLYQIPFARDLHNRLLKHDIRFIYISVDTNRNNWEKKVIENPDLFNESFRVRDPDAPFLKAIGFSRIPRYLIFDRKGRLIDSDAVRPSDETVDNRLITLLNEKEVD